MQIDVIGKAFVAAIGILFAASSQAAAAPVRNPGSVHIKVIGSLATVNQFTRLEEPFWTQALRERTGGRVTAEIVPFDRSGIAGQEMVRLMGLGIVPFGTFLLGVASAEEPSWGAVDLAGLNDDMNTLAANVKAFRPKLAKLLLERNSIVLLGIYAYPAQVLWCRKPFGSLHDLRSRVIRVATPSQSDFFEALGAKPVRTPFAEVTQRMNSGAVDCAVTGTMSGYTINLHKTASHVHSMPINWGMSVLGANSKAWNALPADVRSLLKEDLLPKLESDIWDEARRETQLGIDCVSGNSVCPGEPGNMVVVDPSNVDIAQRKEIFKFTVLPNWINRCGKECADIWNSTLKKTTGIEATSEPIRYLRTR